MNGDMPQGPYPYAALHAPVAPYTWEVRADLAGTEESTGRIPASFNRPVEIVGFFPLVSLVRPAAGGGLVNATLDDIDVQVDLNDEERFTRRLSSGVVTGAGASSHVALSALSSANNGPAARLVRIQSAAPAPDFGFTFMWRQFLAGTPIFETTRISLAMFARYLSSDEIARLRG